ncbi:hypothetical protein SK128_001167, partial [Halocaridina rubra]
MVNEEDDREAEILAVENEWRMPMLGDENDRDITKEKVRLALRATKAGKAPGIDGCHAECLSKGGEVLLEWMDCSVYTSVYSSVDNPSQSQVWRILPLDTPNSSGQLVWVSVLGDLVNET